MYVHVADKYIVHVHVYEISTMYMYTVCCHICIDSMGTMWLPGLKSVCTGSHDYHMTFTALETLLTLLAYSSSSSRHTATSCDLRSAVGVLCPDVSTVARDESFLEVIRNDIIILGCHVHVHVLMRDEKEGRKKRARSNKVNVQYKAKQHSTPKAVTFPKKDELPRVGLKPTTLFTLDRALYH